MQSPQIWGGKPKMSYVTGTTPVSSSQTTKVTIGFKPKVVFVGGGTYWVFYNQDLNPNMQYRGGSASGTNPMPYTASGSNYIQSIDDDGFTLKTFTNGMVSATYYAYDFETE